jgi:hypothetical protein
MKKLLLFALLTALLIASATEIQAFTLSGNITGGVFLGGITYVYAVRVDSIALPPEFGVGLALLGTGPYLVLNVNAGDYILFAYQDRDNNVLPSAGDYFGWYGDTLPEVVTVTGNTSGLNIEVNPTPILAINGTLTYNGTNTGLTILQAATDPDFQNIEHFSILLDSTGTGDYTILADSGTYFVRAFMDMDLSFSYTQGDPMGYYGAPNVPNAVTITATPAQNINFTIYDPVNVAITLTPVGIPTIPPAGGSFNYTVNIINQGNTPATFEAWIDVLLPNGNTIGPILLRTLTLPAGGGLTRNMSQFVPGSAPAGVYNYNGYVGYYPALIFDESGFTFTKLGNRD